MSYTTIELVQKHVIAPVSGETTTITVEVAVSGSAWIELNSGVIKAGSALVTALKSIAPQSEELVFNNSQAQSSLAPIANGSVTIASDSSLGITYSENTDYTVDHQTGSITAVTGGALPADVTVHLWYLPLTSYSEGVDFEIDYALGRIRRMPGGALISGQSVLVTLTPSTRELDTAVFTEAVNEANQQVSAAVDPNQDFGADLNLQSAATYLAAGIVCRVAGTLALAATADKKAATMWLELAASFRQDGATALDRFRPPRKNLSSPQNA